MNKAYKYDSFCSQGENAADKTKEFHDKSNGANRRNGFLMKDINVDILPYEPVEITHTLTLIYPTSLSLKVNDVALSYNTVDGNRLSTVANISESDNIRIELVHENYTFLYELDSDGYDVIFYDDVLTLSSVVNDLSITFRVTSNLTPIVHFVCEDSSGITELVINGSDFIIPDEGEIDVDREYPLNNVTKIDFTIVPNEGFIIENCSAYINSAYSTAASLTSNGDSYSLPLNQQSGDSNVTEFWVVFSAKAEPTNDYMIELHITPSHISSFELNNLAVTNPQKNIFVDFVSISESEQQISVNVAEGCTLVSRTVDGVKTTLNSSSDTFSISFDSSKYGSENPYIIVYESTDIQEEADNVITISGLDNANVSYNGETLVKSSEGSTFVSKIYTSENAVTINITAMNGYRFNQNPYLLNDGGEVLNVIFNQNKTSATVYISNIENDVTIIVPIIVIPTYSVSVTCPSTFTISSNVGTPSTSISGAIKTVSIANISENSDVELTLSSDQLFYTVSGSCSVSLNNSILSVEDINSNILISFTEKKQFIDNGLVGNIVAQCAATYQFEKLMSQSDADENGASYIYSNTNPFYKRNNGTYRVRDSEGNACIDCSAFIGLVMRGIPYRNSPYYKYPAIDSEIDKTRNWVPSEELPDMYGSEGWEFPELDQIQDNNEYGITQATDIGFSGYKTVRYASDMARFFEKNGYTVFDVGSSVDNLWYNNSSDSELSNVIPWDTTDSESFVSLNSKKLCELLQPGDLLFWSKRAWFLNSKSKTLSSFGISISGVPKIGDTITVVLNGTEVSYSSNTENEIEVTIHSETFKSAVDNINGNYTFSYNWKQAGRYRKISHIAIVAEKTDRYFHVSTSSNSDFAPGDNEDDTTQSGGVMYPTLTPNHMRYLCLIVRPNYREKCEGDLEYLKRRNLINYPPRWSSQINSIPTSYSNLTYTSISNNQLELNGVKGNGNSFTRYIRGANSDGSNIVKDNVIYLEPGEYEVALKEISGMISTVSTKSGTINNYKGTGFSLNVSKADGTAIPTVNGTAKCQAYVGHFATFRITEKTAVRVGLYIGTNEYDFDDYIFEPSIKLLSFSDIEWEEATAYSRTNNRSAGFELQSTGIYQYSTSVSSEDTITRALSVDYISGASYKLTFDVIPSSVWIKTSSSKSTVECSTSNGFSKLDSSLLRFDTADKTITIHSGAIGNNDSAQYLLIGFSGFSSGTIPKITKIEYCNLDLGTASEDSIQPYFSEADILDALITHEVDITGETIPYSRYSITVKDDQNIFNPAIEDNAAKDFSQNQMFELYSIVCDYGNVLSASILLNPDYYITKVGTARLKNITAGDSSAVFNLIGPIEFYDNQYLSNDELLLSSSINKISIKEYLQRIFGSDIDVSAFEDNDKTITPFSTESKSEIVRIIAQSHAMFLDETTDGKICFKTLGGLKFAAYDSNEVFKLSLDKQVQNPTFSKYDEPVDSIKLNVYRNNIGLTETIGHDNLTIMVKSINSSEEGTYIDDGSSMISYITAGTTDGNTEVFYDENGNVQSSTDFVKVLNKYNNLKYIRFRFYLEKKCNSDSLRFKASSIFGSDFKNPDNQSTKDLAYNVSRFDFENAGYPKRSGCIVTENFIDFWFTYNSLGGRFQFSNLISTYTNFEDFFYNILIFSVCIISKITGNPIESDSFSYYFQPFNAADNEYVVDNPLITSTRQAEILASYLLLVKNRRIYDAEIKWRGDCSIQTSDKILTATPIGAGEQKTFENYQQGIVVKNEIDFNGGLTETTVVAIPQQRFVEKENSDENLSVSIGIEGLSFAEDVDIK